MTSLNDIKTYQFHAFISYKRGGSDERWAKWLQSRLEAYRIPTQIALSLPKDATAPDSSALPQKENADSISAGRRFKIFRDKTDLGSHPDLTTGLHESLSKCHYLIVICSPRSAVSPYVDNEVRYFIENGRLNCIIPFIIDGTPAPQLENEHACYPPHLPLSALGITLAEGAKDEALIKIVARLLRVDYAKLYGRHVRQQRRFMAIALSVVCAVLVAVSGLAFWAVTAEQKATAQRQEAERLIRFLTFDLRDQIFDYIPVKARENITETVDAYYQRWASDSVEARYNKAMHLVNQSALNMDRGNKDTAMAQAEAALALIRDLSDPIQGDAALATARVEALGILLTLEHGRHNKVRVTELIEELLPALRIHRQDTYTPVEYQAIRVNALELVGTFTPGHIFVISELENILHDLQKKVDAGAMTPETLDLLSQTQSLVCAQKISIKADGLSYCKDAVAAAERWIEKDPHNHKAQRRKLNALETLAGACVASAKFDEVLETAAVALPLQEKLLQRDPDNVLWRLSYTILRLYQAQGDYLLSLNQGNRLDIAALLDDCDSLLNRAKTQYGDTMAVMRFARALSHARHWQETQDLRNASRLTLVKKREEARSAFLKQKGQRDIRQSAQTHNEAELRELFGLYEAHIAALSRIAMRHMAQTDWADALMLLTEQEQLIDALCEAVPKSSRALRLRMDNWGMIASMHSNLLDMDTALAYATKAFDLAQAMLRVTRQSPSFLSDAAGTGLALHDVYRKSGDWKSALAAITWTEKNLEIAQSLPGSGPRERSFATATKLIRANFLHSCGHYGQAFPLMEEVIELSRKAKSKMTIANNRLEGYRLANALSHYAEMLYDLGRQEEGDRALAEAESLFTEVTPSVVEIRRDKDWNLAFIRAVRARHLLDSNKPDAALALIRENFSAAADDTPAAGAQAADKLTFRHNWYCQQVEALMALKQQDDAGMNAEYAVSIWDAMSSGISAHPRTKHTTAWLYGLTGEIALSRGDVTTAESSYLRAATVLAATFSTHPASQAFSLQEASSADTLIAFLGDTTDIPPEPHLLRIRILQGLARTRIAQGHNAQARLFSEIAVKSAQALHAVEPRQVYWLSQLHDIRRLHADITQQEHPFGASAQ